MNPTREQIESKIQTAQKIINMYKEAIKKLIKDFGEQGSVRETIASHEQEIVRQERIVRAWTVYLNM